MRLSLAVLTVLPFTLLAQEPAETITVTAAATVAVKPDSARIHYLLRVNDQSVDAAKDSIAKLVGTLNDNLKSLKIAELSNSAGATSYGRTVAPRAAKAGFGNPGGGQGTYYAAVPMAAVIRDKDPDKLLKSVDAFLKKVVESGAIISGDGLDGESPFSAASARLALNSGDSPRVEWLLSDDAAARKNAYVAAIRKAKADAETLSKELGWTSLKVVAVIDGPSSGVGPARDMSEFITSSRAATLNVGSVGEVAMTARVTLKCSK